MLTWMIYSYICLYASANVMAAGIMFSECSCILSSVHACVHTFQTNIVSKIPWLFVDGI